MGRRGRVPLWVCGAASLAAFVTFAAFALVAPPSSPHTQPKSAALQPRTFEGAGAPLQGHWVQSVSASCTAHAAQQPNCHIRNLNSSCMSAQLLGGTCAL